MSRSLAAVLAAAFFLRMGYGLAKPPQAPGQALANPDNYVSLASSVAASWSLRDAQGRPSAEREPVFPVLLGLLFKIFGARYWVVLALNAAAGTLALYFLYRAGSMLFDEKVALTAVALGSVYPPFLFYAAQPLRETFMCLMGLAAVCALLEASRRPSLSWGSAAGAGAVNGLASLTNSTFLPFGLILAPLGFLLLRPARQTVGRVALYLAVLAAVYAPWPLRNQLVFQRWIVGSTAGAASTFYIYLIVPQAEGGTPAQEERLRADPVIRRGTGLDPVSAEQFYWKEALRWVGEHPMAYVRLVAWRLFWDMWRLAPRPRAYAHSYAKIRLASLLTDGWIIPLGFVGMLLFRFKQREALWPYLFVASVAFTYSLIFTMLRYRFSLMPWFLLFASYALHEGCRVWKSWRPRPAA